MNQLLKTSFFVGLLLISISSYSQVIDSMIKIYAEEIPQQKAYMHFDKGVYRAGETVWFKAYVFAGYQPATNSKNFFAELIDKDGSILQRKIYPMVESSTAGSFDLPDNTPAGHFIVRGYTTWMLNFDTSFIFQRTIDVVNRAGTAVPEKSASIAPVKTGTSATPATTRTVNMQLFPEGGDLVNDIESVVAFKANDNNGEPVFVGGNVVNSKGETVVSFKAEHDGMGEFTFTPAVNETYTAQWKDDKGGEHSTPFPLAKKEGVVLSVASVGKKKIYIVRRSVNAPPEYQNLIVEAHVAQELVYRAKVPLINTNINSGNINVENLPAGILQLTVFSQKWEPLAERIVMVNNDNYTFDVKFRPTESNFNIRAKSAFEISTGDTLLSNLSVSVTDAAIANKSNADNLISRMLLTGDIKGYVANPAYYFSNTSDTVTHHLDLVMLTHGWRRFKWADIANAKRPVLKFPKDDYLSLNAKVFGITPYNPLRRDEQLVAILTAKDSTKKFLEMPKTGTDVFSLNNLVFFDTVTVHYQFAKDKNLNNSGAVQFGNGLYGGVRKVDPNNLPYYFSTDKDTMMLNRTKFLAQQLTKYSSSWDGKGNVLQGVTVKARVKTKLEELDDKYTSGLFKGDAYTFDMTENFSMDIFTYLQGRVPGLTISNSGGQVSVSWRGSPTSFFLDEIPAQADQLQNISPSDIAYVKVFRPPFFGATGGGAGGAIAIYTRKGGDVKMEPGKGLSRTQVVGYSRVREFYVPDYSSRSVSADVPADYRSTLYWNPYLLLNTSKNTTKIEFYNNDVTKAFRVVIEGVDEAGKLIRIEKVIQ